MEEIAEERWIFLGWRWGLVGNALATSKNGCTDRSKNWDVYVGGGKMFQSWIFSRELMRGVHLRRMRLNAGTLLGRL